MVHISKLILFAALVLAPAVAVRSNHTPKACHLAAIVNKPTEVQKYASDNLILEARAFANTYSPRGKARAASIAPKETTLQDVESEVQRLRTFMLERADCARYFDGLIKNTLKTLKKKYADHLKARRDAMSPHGPGTEQSERLKELDEAMEDLFALDEIWPAGVPLATVHDEKKPEEIRQSQPKGRGRPEASNSEERSKRRRVQSGTADTRNSWPVPPFPPHEFQGR